MKSKLIGSDILLLITALIWGFAFVAQRAGMEYVGPFTFNAVRFALGSCSLIPLVLYFSNRIEEPSHSETILSFFGLIWRGGLTGVVLYAAASLQQVGLVYTTAGKAGFITGLYVVIVPIIWMVFGQKSGINTWMGAILAAIGLYFLSVTESFTIQFGDLLEIIGAFFWAIHVILVGYFSRRINPVHLSLVQFTFCSLLSFITALALETIEISALSDALIPILYGGLCSVGIAYTLQVVAQRNAHPAHAAILLSLESVFAAVGGWLLLNEVLPFRSKAGCALMFAGMLVSQLRKNTLKKAG
ncbi:MAG: DMT family transporter [Proteobacteria bacterium]|nr:DMT family transporter [Pseudomonadota bacterium]